MHKKVYIFDNTVIRNFALANRFGILKALYEGSANVTRQVIDEANRGIRVIVQYLVGN